MTKEKINPRYIFDNPNTPKEVEEVLRKILLEKLLFLDVLTIHKVN